jgi:NAD(P)-dependent dehydrogenase (short-subunit alcohol dehydrogenase family)
MERSRDDEVLVVSGDIADRKTAERAISEGMARFGRIDTLVNNAGIFIAKPFTQYTEADCTAMLAVNLTGFFHVTQLAVAEMEKQGSGHIVQITTSLVDHAIAGVPSVLASLTKGGLNAANAPPRRIRALQRVIGVRHIAQVFFSASQGGSALRYPGKY